MAMKIRFAEPADAGAILAIYAPYCESTPVSFEIVAPSLDEMRRRMEKVLVQYPWLVCEIDGRVVGYVYASQHRERAAYRWAVDVAVYVAVEHHRRCVGRALYTSLFQILREQGYFKAYAGITLPNPGSVRLHESVGFEPIGVFPGEGFKLGAWRDVGWWGRALCPETAEPTEPLPIRIVRESDATVAALAAGERLLRASPSRNDATE
jgi:phosphinothricin acetyltransferase